MLLRHFGYGRYGPARRGKRLRPQMVMRVAGGEGAALENALDAAVPSKSFTTTRWSTTTSRIATSYGTAAARYGARTASAQAINAGDAMCALSFLSLEHAAEFLDARRVLQMIALLHEAHAVMCEGQSLDLRFESEMLVGLERLSSHDRMQDRAALRRVVPFGRACRRLQRRNDRRLWRRRTRIRDGVSDPRRRFAAFGRRSTKRAKSPASTSPAENGPFRSCGRSPSRARRLAKPSRRPMRWGGRWKRAEVERVVVALEELGAREAARERGRRTPGRHRAPPQ